MTEWLKKDVKDIYNPFNNLHKSIVLKFNLSIRTSKLTKTSHYTEYQQRLYDEVKRLKEVEGYGYRRISYILYDKGYKSIRTNSILKNNSILSIYSKGKIREQRINREFKPTISDIMMFECF